MKDNWNNINESFFDDIEDDLNDNEIIDKKSVTKLYGITDYYECETPEDYAQFIIENSHFIQIYEAIYSYLQTHNVSITYFNFPDIIKRKQLQGPIYRPVIHDRKIQFIHKYNHKTAPDMLISITTFYPNIFELKIMLERAGQIYFMKYTNMYDPYEDIKDSMYNTLVKKISTKNNLDVMESLKELHLYESFFDDVENDLNNNDIIDNKSVKTLYGITSFDECETAEDFADFFIEHSHIKEIVKTLSLYVKNNTDEIFYRFTKIFKNGDITDNIYDKIYIRRNYIIFTTSDIELPPIHVTDRGKAITDHSVTLSILINLYENTITEIQVPIIITDNGIIPNGFKQYLIKQINKIPLDTFNQYKTHKLNESFFDDVEDDLESDYTEELEDVIVNKELLIEYDAKYIEENIHSDIIIKTLHSNNDPKKTVEELLSGIEELKQNMIEFNADDPDDVILEFRTEDNIEFIVNISFNGQVNYTIHFYKDNFHIYSNSTYHTLDKQKEDFHKMLVKQLSNDFDRNTILRKQKKRS